MRGLQMSVVKQGHAVMVSQTCHMSNMMYAYRSTADCNADIGLAQSRCVIDAITNHCYSARFGPFNTGSSGHCTRLQLCNLGGLVNRQHLMYIFVLRAFSTPSDSFVTVLLVYRHTGYMWNSDG